MDKEWVLLVRQVHELNVLRSIFQGCKASRCALLVLPDEVQPQDGVGDDTETERDTEGADAET